MNRQEYEEKGIVWPMRAIDPSEATELVSQYRRFQTEAIKQRGRECHIKPHLISTWLDSIVHLPAILDAVEVALGPNILLWLSDFAVKEAGKGTWVPWHQDSPYWNLSTSEVVSVWLALSPATRDNGAMRVIPGTHRSGALGSINFEGDPHSGYKAGKRTASEGNIFAYDYTMDQPIDESLAMDVELEPGEFSLHNIELVHGGGPNHSDEDRIGFVMRFISADTHCRTGKDSAMLMRGEGNSDHFEFEPRPESDFSVTSLAAAERALSFPSGFGDRLVQ